MLILARRVGEALVLNDDIFLKVVGVNGDQVKISIDAPGDVAIHRGEASHRIQAKDEEEGQSQY